MVRTGAPSAVLGQWVRPPDLSPAGGPGTGLAPRLLVWGAVWRERGRLQRVLEWGEQVEPQGLEKMKLLLSEFYCLDSLKRLKPDTGQAKLGWKVAV